MPDKEKKHSIKIFVNNNAFETKEREMSGSSIKGLAGVPADYELFEVQGNHTTPVGNDQVVKLHENMHFRAIPAGTFGTWQFLLA